MKEIIYNIDGVAGRVITLTGLTGTFTKNNVIGIINKSQGDVLYTPMDWNLLTFAYSNGTMTLTLADSVTAITAGDKLLVKLYSDSDLTVADIQSGLAKETSVKDGNDTAIGMLKDQTNGLAAIKSAIPTDYAKQGSDATATNSAIMAAIIANAGVPTLTIPSTTSSQELAPNTLYIFAERSSDLTITLGTPITGIANEYHLFLITGSTAPTITWPSGISWNGGSAPTIAAEKTYEVSILNNIAAFFEV